MSYFVRSAGLPKPKDDKPLALMGVPGAALLSRRALEAYQRHRMPAPPEEWGTAVKVNREFSPQPANSDGIKKRILRQGAVGSDIIPPHKRHPLPELPEGLRWPKDFNQAPEYGRHPEAPGGVVAYLAREWQEIIAAKKIDMPTLWENFPWVARAINTYTKPHPKTGERRTLPPELTIPTYPQVNTQKLARAIAGEDAVDAKEARRLGAALARRLAKGRVRDLSL